VKARHSAFYATQLELLLRAEQIERVALCGQVTEQCVLYTALDAHIREFEVLVAGPAVAHIDERLARAALEMMERNLGSRVCGSVGELIRELS
jgi:nicotinamidase-related amidase